MDNPVKGLSLGRIVLRHAVAADTFEIARLHVRVWQWGYPGQLPDAYLDALDSSIPQCEALRREGLSRLQREVETWVAECDGRIVPFADIGPSRNNDASTRTGELWSIHVDGTLARRGIGRTLMRVALDELRAQEFTEATLWVLDSNRRARGFYEALDWQPDGAIKVVQRPGVDLHEVRYRQSLT